MAGLFSRLHIWNPGEDLSALDLNNEFNNILANVDALHSEGYSANLSQMQAQENPGDLGTENLTQPISVADEIERLRFVIARIIGLPFWYQTPPINLEQIAAILNAIADVSPSRIISGLTTALTIQPNYLLAQGASGIEIDVSSVDLVYYVDNVQYTMTTLNTLATIPALNPAPSTNNTAILTSVFDGLQDSTGVQTFKVGTVGANITARSGVLSGFSINNGTDTEYFIGTPVISGSSGVINGISRGFMFDDTATNVPGITLTTGHTITLLDIAYLFVTSTYTLVVTYDAPFYGINPPPTPNAGDYWYDLINQTWKTFVLGNWIKSNAAYAGIALTDSSASTVATRSADFFEVFEQTNSIVLDTVTNSTVTNSFIPLGYQISVYGKTEEILDQNILITMPTNLIPGETLTANTVYYIYVDRENTFYFGSVIPMVRNDILGLYAPAEALRAIGQVSTDGSSNFIPASLVMYAETLSETALSSAGTQEHCWEFNGDTTSLGSFPATFLDSDFLLDSGINIRSSWVECGSCGPSGTTEFDLKYQTDVGQPFTSVYSTTGKIAFSAAIQTITYGSLVNGPFVNGETITGGTSGTTATVFSDDGVSYLVVQNVSSPGFTATETITGGTSGATAAANTIVVGGDFPVYTDSGTEIAPQFGVTKPIISTPFIPAGSLIRWDLIQTMATPNLNARIRIKYVRTGS